MENIIVWIILGITSPALFIKTVSHILTHNFSTSSKLCKVALLIIAHHIFTGSKFATGVIVPVLHI